MTPVILVVEDNERNLKLLRDVLEYAGYDVRVARTGEDAITLAVIASVRHQDTGYDSLLMSAMPRDAARDAVRPDIDRVLARWRKPNRTP